MERLTRAPPITNKNESLTSSVGMLKPSPCGRNILAELSVGTIRAPGSMDPAKVLISRFVAEKKVIEGFDGREDRRPSHHERGRKHSYRSSPFSASISPFQTPVTRRKGGRFGVKRADVKPMRDVCLRLRSETCNNARTTGGKTSAQRCCRRSCTAFLSAWGQETLGNHLQCEERCTASSRAHR